MKKILLLMCLVLTATGAYSQLNIHIKEIAENHIIISGSSSLPSTPPPDRKFMIQLEDLVEENSAGNYTIIKNTLMFGTVGIERTIHYTNGNFAIQSSDTEILPFLANTAISGELEIIFNNIQVSEPRSNNPVYWGLNPGARITVGSFTIVGPQVIVDGDLKADGLKIKNPILFRAELSQDIDWQSQADDTIKLTNVWADALSPAHQMVYDVSDNFDATSGDFTAPCTGYYQFDVHLLFEGERFFDHIFDLFIAVNDSLEGNTIKDHFSLTSGGNTNAAFPAKFSHSLGATIYLQAGDKTSLHMAFLDDVGFGAFMMKERSSFSGRLLPY